MSRGGRAIPLPATPAAAVALVVAAVVLLGGCGLGKPKPPKPRAAEPRRGLFGGGVFAPITREPSASATAADAGPTKLAPADPDAPRDAQPVVPIVFHVDVYQLTLPWGAVSRNDEFWARLNEQVINPASYDVLQRNGLRVGEASFADWEFFKSLIDQHPGTVAQAQAVAKEARNIELEMKKDVQFQNVFYFDARNQLLGRSFDRSDNLISISFQPTPRKPGFMRLTVAPVVRSQRKRLDYSILNNELTEVQFVSPETFYDCNLRLDVPVESFIVIGPSPEAAVSTSVGATFLVKDGKSQREEQVLIIVPRPFRVGDR